LCEGGVHVTGVIGRGRLVWQAQHQHGVQVARHLFARGVAQLRALLQRHGQHQRQRLGQAGAVGSDIWRRLGGDHLHEPRHRVALVRQRAGQQLVQQHAQRVEVAAAVHGEAGQLFG